MIHLLPKDEKFYNELESLGGMVRDASTELTGLLQRYPETADSLRAIQDYDRRADELTQSGLERLDQAFITPLDREDILHLLTDLYAVVASIAAFAQRLAFYKPANPQGDLHQQAGNLAEMAECVCAIMQRLRQDHRLKTLNGEMKKLHQLERRSHETREEFLSRLFAGEPNPLEVMKKKELHDLLESAIRNCQEVSRTLQRVVLKND